jgi:NhaA family Na+:H+ antiporter
VLNSGVHATLAGVITAFAVPMSTPAGRSPLREAEEALHPWVSFLVLPGFAFANAGVSLAGVNAAALAHPVTLGIALGLVLGKTIGVLGATWLVVRAGLAVRPAGASWTQVSGMSLLAGIGFTMSLFIGELAFEGQGPGWEARVKLGVLGGSLVAAALGAAVLTLAAARDRTPAPRPRDPRAA